MVDLERHCPIDLLPDRTPETVAAWLAAHPTINVITRDRSGGYAEAATVGAPQATQVADRWHLLHNLATALEYFLGHHRAALKQAAQEIASTQETAHKGQRMAPPLDGLAVDARAEAAGIVWQQDVIDQYHRIHTLRAAGVPVKEIATQLGISRRTVHRYACRPTPPDRRRAQVTRSLVLEPFVPYLLQRWNEGCRNASQLWRELRDQHGYRQSLHPISLFIGALRQESGTRFKFKSVGAEALYHVDQVRKRPLSVRQASHLFLVPPDRQSAWQVAYCTRLCALDPAIARAYTLVQTFATMVRQRMGAALDAWLGDVAASGITELTTFAQGLQRDYAAVKAGLTEEWSNGQTEAQVHRLKLVKRQMYGKASFALLRKRVLHRA